MTEALRDALGQIAGKNDLSGVSNEDLESAACNALHECELIARAALAATPAAEGDAVAEALKPFVDALDSIDKDTPPNQRCGDYECIGDALWDFDQPTVGDLRKLVSAQPASPLRGREREAIATIIDPVAAYHHAAANTANYKDAYEKADAILALSAAPPEQPAAATATGREEKALAKALDAAIHLINRYRTVASDIQFEQVLDAENDFGLALDELPDNSASSPTAPDKKALTGETGV